MTCRSTDYQHSRIHLVIEVDHFQNIRKSFQDRLVIGTTSFHILM